MGRTTVCRKMFIVLALAALLVGVLAPAALAINKGCTTYPCYGTHNNDKLAERVGNGVPDQIYGLRGNDNTIHAGIFVSDDDILLGGRGNDTLNALDADGRDTLKGGPGFDVCIIDELYGKDVTQGCERVEEDKAEAA
jgi:hypothetical protein